MDLNGNGIPDERDPAFYGFLWRVVRFFGLSVAAPHTVFHRVVKTADQAYRELGGR